MAEPQKNQKDISVASSHSPFSLPKPSPSAFNSTGKLAKKHDSIHERLSLPIHMETPGTPKSSRSRFVLPSTLSPFPFSPKQIKLKNDPVEIELDQAALYGSTPLRHGVSSDQLVFDTDIYGKLSHSPSRLFFDKSLSSSSSITKEVDMNEILSEFGSEIYDIEVDDEFTKFGSCDLQPCMLRPLVWRNSNANFFSFDYLSSINDNEKEDDVFNTIGSAFEQNLSNDYFSENFELIETLEGGSFSSVFTVIEKETRDISVIKRSSKQFSGTADRQRKLQEVYHMYLLKGESHCVQVQLAWEQNGYLFIQMEFCENGSLKDVIEYMAASDKKFSEDQIWNIIRQLSIGIHNIHCKNILHLDIKPANIFIDRHGSLKIGDFGLSAQIGTKYDPDSEGDKVYMAPEVLEGTFDTAADVFSLGMIALELAADVVLPSEGELWQAIRAGNLSSTYFEGCSEKLVCLIKALITPIPFERPTIDQVIAMIPQSHEHRPSAL